MVHAISSNVLQDTLPLFHISGFTQKLSGENQPNKLNGQFHEK